MRLSIGDAATWTAGFLRREGRLVAPVALAFLALPSLAVQLLVPSAGMVPTDMTKFDPRLLWMLLVALVGVAGGMTITTMALRPGVSVGEALVLAGRRFWVWLVIALLLLLIFSAVLVVMSFIGLLGGVSIQSLTGLGVTVTMGLVLVATARLLPLVPVVMDGGLGPVASLRRTWALTGGSFWRLLGLILVMVLLSGLIQVALIPAIGAVTLLLDRLTGAAPLFGAIGAVILTTVGAAISGSLYVLVAGIYRQLAGR